MGQAQGCVQPVAVRSKLKVAAVGKASPRTEPIASPRVAVRRIEPTAAAAKAAVPTSPLLSSRGGIASPPAGARSVPSPQKSWHNPALHCRVGKDVAQSRAPAGGYATPVPGSV